MKYWIIITQSCLDCDTVAVKLVSHEPTLEEKMETQTACRELCCVHTITSPVYLDMPAIEVEDC